LTGASAATPRIVVWEGVFDSWEEACQTSATPEGGFSTDRWLRRMTDQLTQYRQEYGTHGVALPPRPTNLPWVCAITRPRILVDFGGSSGWCWDYLRHTVADPTIEAYVIVETVRVVEHMEQSGLHTAPVSYVTAASVLPRCDLLYCNSVLPYFGSNAEFLDVVERTDPAHVLLDDLLANAEHDTYSRQRYYDLAMPHRFIGLRQLTSELQELGYRTYINTPHPSPILGVFQPLPMENLPATHRIRYASSVLFGKVRGTPACPPTL
jgi:putative methyltransferase (TIGR04325 family)